MPSAEYDLHYLQAGIDLLEKYLLAPDLFWALGIQAARGEPPYPRLTLGGLLLAQKRAEAREKTAEQQARLDRLQRKMAEIRSQWRAAWGNKAASEFRARLTIWSNFLQDYRDNREAHYDRYAYEVRRRVQLQLLLPDAEGVPETELNLLKALDRLVEAVFVPGNFIWDRELEPVFPPQDYWYLYGAVKAE